MAQTTAASEEEAYGIRPLTEKEYEAFQSWRLLAWTRAPYYAIILHSFRPVAAKIGTMGVDRGLRLYIDFDTAEEWGDEECSQVLLHECGHVIGEHLKLADSLGLGGDQRSAKMLNIAGDMSINDDLSDMGCEFIARTGVMPGAIGAPNYLSAIEYYDLLDELDEKRKKDQGSGADGDGGSGGEDFDHSQGCGSIAHGVDAPWDLGDDDLGGEAPPADSAELSRIIDNAKSSLDLWATNNPGSATAGNTGKTEERGHSIVHWTARLAPVLSSSIARSGRKSKTSYRKINRRFTPRAQGSRVLLPGRVPLSVNVGCMIDTSGSMKNHHAFGVVMREVAGIHQKVVAGRGKTFVIDADTEVHDIREYKGKGSITTMRGCGGTSMENAILSALADSRLRKGEGKIGALFVITDGETGWPSEDSIRSLTPRIPVVAAVISRKAGPARDVPSWIPAVHILPSEIRG